jgi:hypothetical protein
VTNIVGTSAASLTRRATSTIWSSSTGAQAARVRLHRIGRERHGGQDDSVLVASGVMRNLKHPIAVFVVAVLVVVGIGVGVLARTGIPSHAARTLQTPASILARAKLGTEGTFSTVYQLSGAKAPLLADNATLTIAQRAPAGTAPSPGRGIGMWSYRLTYTDGSGVEFVVRRGLLEDCTRVRAGKWQCTGPGRFEGFHCTYGCIDYSIGYMLATMPYLPNRAFNLLGLAVENLDSLHSRSERSRFGPLTCVDVDSDETLCLLSNGLVDSLTGPGPGDIGFPWTKARLVSEQSTAPMADFDLSGVPKEPYILLMPWSTTF